MSRSHANLDLDVDTVTDETFLCPYRYALTLEHLEDTFYRESLAKLDEKAFSDAGYGPWVRQRFQEIGGHEADRESFRVLACVNTPHRR